MCSETPWAGLALFFLSKAKVERGPRLHELLPLRGTLSEIVDAQCCIGNFNHQETKHISKLIRLLTSQATNRVFLGVLCEDNLFLFSFSVLRMWENVTAGYRPQSSLYHIHYAHLLGNQLRHCLCCHLVCYLANMILKPHLVCML